MLKGKSVESAYEYIRSVAIRVKVMSMQWANEVGLCEWKTLRWVPKK